MMKKEADKEHLALVRATKKTFANMAFVDVAEIPDHPGQVHAGQLTHIVFTQPIEAQITLYLSTPVTNLVVVNIFGRSVEEIGSGEFDDCLLELLNVLAGNFLKELGVSEGKHNVSLPQLLFDDSDIVSRTKFRQYYFDAEGDSFVVSVN